MIVRKQPDGGLILIPQTDHSKLVGQLAAHWGNARFATPEPFDSVVRAAAFHDYGWLRYETGPIINPESGETPEFRQIPPSPTQLEAFQWSLDWLASIDRYSGLIISMHRTGLWRGRYETIRHPEVYNRTLSPEVQDFLAKNEAWQERERTAWDAGQLRTNYRLLQVWDLLGLYFCCQEPRDDYVEPVPVGYDGGETDGIRLTLTPVSSRTVALDPYPFDARPCRVQLSFKRLPKTSYPDLETFRRAYFQGENDLMRFELV